MSAGSVATLKTYPVLPLRTYDKFDVDPMFVLSNSFSKLRKIGEGAALQIILGPAESSYGKKIKKTAEEIRKGEKLSEALKKPKLPERAFFFHRRFYIFRFFAQERQPRKRKKQEKEKMVNEDLAKMIEEKASRPLMSANLRVLVSADSQEKSDNILKEIESAFLQFTEPQGNALKFRGLKGKELDNLFL